MGQLKDQQFFGVRRKLNHMKYLASETILKGVTKEYMCHYISDKIDVQHQ